MTIRRKNRSGDIAEKQGATVGYQVSTPGRADKGYIRYHNQDGKSVKDIMGNIGVIVESRHKTHIKEETKAGDAFGATGGELEPGESYSKAFRESFWQSKGEKGVYDFNSKMEEYLSKNPNVDPSVAQAEIQGMFDTMLAGKNDSFTIGFAPRAYAAMKNGVDNHAAIQTKMIRSEDLDNKGNEFRNLIVPGADPTEIHELWTSKRKEYVQAGYTKDEINQEFVGQLTEYAIQNKDESVFDVGKIKDKSNLSLRDTGNMADLLRAGYNKTVNAIDHSERNDEKLLTKNRTEWDKQGYSLISDIRLDKDGSLDKLQELVDSKDLDPTSHKIFTKALTDEKLGLNKIFDQDVTKQVIARTLSSDSDDDYTEAQLQHFYLEGQISSEVFSSAMRKSTVTSSSGFKGHYNSNASLMVRDSMDNLKLYKYLDPSDGEKTLTDYFTMAQNDYKTRIMELMDGDEKVTQQLLRDIGKEVKEKWQDQAEKSEQSPLKMLVDTYQGQDTADEFFNIYRYLSGDPNLSMKQINDELIQLGAALDPNKPVVQPQVNTGVTKVSQERGEEFYQNVKVPQPGEDVSTLTHKPNYKDPNSQNAFSQGWDDFMKMITVPDYVKANFGFDITKSADNITMKKNH